MAITILSFLMIRLLLYERLIGPTSKTLPTAFRSCVNMPTHPCVVSNIRSRRNPSKRNAEGAVSLTGSGTYYIWGWEKKAKGRPVMEKLSESRSIPPRLSGR
jgi:hypothetical protein